MGSLKYIYISIIYIFIILTITWFFSLCNMDNLEQVVKNETLLSAIYFIVIVAFGIYVYLKKIDYIKIYFLVYIIFILSQGILFLLKIDCMGEYPNDFKSFYYSFIIVLLRGLIIISPIILFKFFGKRYKRM